MTSARFLSTFLLTVLMVAGISVSCQTFTNTIRWPEHKVADKQFWAFTAGLGITSFADVRSSFENRALGYKVNPIMRPFMNAGTIPAYAMVGGIDGGLTAFSYEAKKRHWKFWRLPIAVGIGAHSFAFGVNINLSRQQ
ncbi:MAG TPA: hypothetical protein VIJ29_01270 [Candidatus Paceibacterota bacterium]